MAKTYNTMKVRLSTLMVVDASKEEGQYMRDLRNTIDRDNKLRTLGSRIAKTIGFDETDGHIVLVKGKLFGQVH